jgi:ABC-type sugar transport system ATPase subunit
VAVLVDGRIAQASTPRELYARPTSPEVAMFLGAMNLVPGTFDGQMVRTDFGLLDVEPGHNGALPTSGRAIVLLRPEQLEVADDPSASPRQGEVVHAEFLGHDLVVRVRADGEEAPTLVARVAGNRRLAIGARVGVRAEGPVVAWTGPDRET